MTKLPLKDWCRNCGNRRDSDVCYSCLYRLYREKNSGQPPLYIEEEREGVSEQKRSPKKAPSYSEAKKRLILKKKQGGRVNKND